jgi:preprotein translocase subunit SecG
MQTFLYVLHFIVCFVLIGVVLLQRGKGADLGASLGGGGANTIFGSRGAGNFLSKMTTASAIIFMCTSLSLSYLGYQASDVQLFDETQPFEVPGASGTLPDADSGGLEEIPVEVEETGGLVEIPQPEAAPAAEAEMEVDVEVETPAP